MHFHCAVLSQNLSEPQRLKCTQSGLVAQEALRPCGSACKGLVDDIMVSSLCCYSILDHEVTIAVGSHFDADRTERLRKLFHEYDRDNSDDIDEKELSLLFRDLGHDPRQKRIRNLLKKHSGGSAHLLDHLHKVTFEQFLAMSAELDHTDNFSPSCLPITEKNTVNTRDFQL